MSGNEKRLILIFLTVVVAGLLFLFLNRYRFYYNYVKIALNEEDIKGKRSSETLEKKSEGLDSQSADGGQKSPVTVQKHPSDTGKRETDRGYGRYSDPASGPNSGLKSDKIPGRAGKVNINKADLNTLMSLPGIGRVTALNIMEYRTRKGCFTNVQELLEVKGIGEKKLDAVSEFVVVE